MILDANGNPLRRKIGFLREMFRESPCGDITAIGSTIPLSEEESIEQCEEKEQ